MTPEEAKTTLAEIIPADRWSDFTDWMEEIFDCSHDSESYTDWLSENGLPDPVANGQKIYDAMGVYSSFGPCACAAGQEFPLVTPFMTLLTFDSEPSLARPYARGVLRRRNGLRKKSDLPELAASWNGVQVDSGRLKTYRELCNIKPSDVLPIHFPHVVASPVQIAMLTERSFPVGIMGCVHLRNHTVLHRPIGVDETFDVRVELADCRFIEKGVEIDMDTILTIDDAEAWKQTTTFLVRQKTKDPEPESALASIFDDSDGRGELLETFDVPEDMGRRYASIGRDYNPIHINRWTAKPFGFKRAIIHGMWTLARVTSDLPEVVAGDPVRVDVAFKGPLYMPGRASFHRVTDEDYRVYAETDDRPAIKIKVQNV